jgi:hypothetical protein
MMISDIEISVNGKWRRARALDAGGKHIVSTGKWLKRAVINSEEWLDTDLDDPEGCVKALKTARAHGLRADIFTFTQKPPATEPRFRYAVERESVAVASTASFDQWWKSLPQETRKNVRRSEKRGVVVSVRRLDDDLIAGIIGVNNDHPVRQGRAYAHYGKSPEQVRKDVSSFLDRSDFICAHVGDELIGFLRIVYRGGVASVLNMLPKASHQDKRPANALIAKAVEICATRGIPWLTYGKFYYNKRREQNPLRDFKIRNGFDEMLIPRYYVPLTLRGALSIKLGLHRGVRDLLPERIITTAAVARAKWYGFKQSQAGVAQ